MTFVYLFHHKLSPYQPKVWVCLCSTLTVTSTCSVSMLVGPCHHSMARPQVADRGTASDKEGSSE